MHAQHHKSYIPTAFGGTNMHVVEAGVPDWPGPTGSGRHEMGIPLRELLLVAQPFFFGSCPVSVAPGMVVSARALCGLQVHTFFFGCKHCVTPFLDLGYWLKLGFC